METGILTYGSVIEDPGDEISAAELRRITGVLTPFAVEFARESKSRKGAPTLVPVSRGGAQVMGCIIVVDASETDAANMLYRREIHQVGSTKRSRPSLWCKSGGHDLSAMLARAALHAAAMRRGCACGSSLRLASFSRLM